MNTTKKILSNTLWQIIGRLFISIIGILSIKLITNYLPTEIYGQYTTIFEYLSFFGIAADFGLYTIGVREMSKQEHPTEFILGNILSLRIILIVLSLGSAFIITPFIPKYSDSLIQSGLYIVVLSTALSLINGILTSVLQYKMKMFFSTIALTIGKTSGFLFTILVIFQLAPNATNQDIAQSFNLLLWSSVITTLVTLFITTFFILKHTKIRPQIDKKYASKLIKNSFPFGISIILSTLYFKIDIILLSQLTDYHQTGIYGVPLRVMEIITVIPVFFMNASLPKLTESFKKSTENFQKTLKKPLQFLILLVLPISLGGFVLATPITYTVSSPQFISGYHCINNTQSVYPNAKQAEQKCPNAQISSKFSWDLNTTKNIPSYQTISPVQQDSYIKLYGADKALQIILLAVIFSFINTLLTFTFITIEKQNTLLYINSIGILFNITSNFILIPKYGFLAAATTTLLSEIIILVTSYFLLKKHIKIPFQPLQTLKILLSSILMASVVYYLQPLTFSFLNYKNILILIPIGAIIYALSILSLKVISVSEIKTQLKIK